MYHILCAVKKAYHGGTGLCSSVGIDNTRSENLCKQLSGCIINFLAGRAVKLRLRQLHIILFTVETDSHELALIHIKEIRFVGIDLFHDLRLRIVLCHKASSQNAEMLQEGIASSGNTVGTFPAHGLPKKWIVSCGHHYTEPIGHIVSLLLRGDKEHQRNT